MTLLLLAALQAAQPWVISPRAPTVGDTVVIERMVVVGPDARLRPQPLGSSLLIEPLADPVVQRAGRGAMVRYTVSLFEPGRHAVEMPSVEVLYRDGRVDQIPPDTAWITIAATLPGADSLPPPRPSRPPLARYPTRQLPLALLVGLVTLSAGAWAVGRRRRRREPPPSSPPRAGGPAPLARWINAGEARAVAAIASERLRERLAALEPRASRTLASGECIAALEEARPEWPMRSLSELMLSLERARFAPAVASDVAILLTQVDALLADLGG